MYYCNLKIHLINCGAIDEAIDNIRPLEHFSHEIFIHDSLDEMSPEMLDGDSILIIKNSDNLRSSVLRPYRQTEATIVLMIERPEILMESELKLFDYIWRLPLTPPMFRFYFKNMLSRLKLKKDLWLTQNYLETLINSVPDLIWFKRKDGVHLKVNEAFCECVNKPFDDVEGFEHAHIWGLTPEQVASGAYDCSDSEIEVMNAGKTLVFHEEVQHATRGTIQLGVYKTPILDEQGNPLGTVGFAQDITKLMEQQDTILKMAQTDALTGLTNRRYFYEYVNDTRGDNMITLCYIDLDKFKAVNDNFGHPFGDAALMGTADALRITFPDELVTRLGGDEFLVTIIGDYDIETLKARLDYLSEKATEFFALSEAFKNLAMSIGVAWTDDPDLPLDNLLRMSDEALYHCKNHNRGGYIFYEDLKALDEVTMNV